MAAYGHTEKMFSVILNYNSAAKKMDICRSILCKIQSERSIANDFSVWRNKLQDNLFVTAEANALRHRIRQWPMLREYIDWERVRRDAGVQEN
jgi:hypothetical protein